MRRWLNVTRRTVAGLALSVSALSLAWLIRTWELSEILLICRETGEVVDGTTYSWQLRADIVSWRGRIQLDFGNSESYPRPATGWRFHRERRREIYAFHPLDKGMAEYLDLTIDGAWPVLQDWWIAFAFYVATDGVAAYGEKMVPDPTGRFFFLLHVPHWLIASVGAGVAVLAIRPDWRAYRRRKRGLCPVCGYDLRTTPERCPECGTERKLVVDG